MGNSHKTPSIQRTKTPPEAIQQPHPETFSRSFEPRLPIKKLYKQITINNNSAEQNQLLAKGQKGFKNLRFEPSMMNEDFYLEPKRMKEFSKKISTFLRMNKLPRKLETLKGYQIRNKADIYQLKNLSCNLLKLRRLSTLKIDLRIWSLDGKEKMEMLCGLIKKFVNLSHLGMKISFSGASINLDGIADCLKHLKFLKHFDLKTDACAGHHLEKGSLEKLTKGLKTIKLFSLSLELNKVWFLEQEVRPFADWLETQAQLTQLKLNFSSGSLIKQEGLHYLLSSTEKLQALSSFELDFGFCVAGKSNDRPNSLQTIQNFSQLTSLSLNFVESNLVGACLYKFSERFKYLPALSSFNLDAASGINDLVIEDLATGIRHLKALSKLILILSNYKSTDPQKAIKKFSLAIKELKSLKSLTLKLSSWSKVSDKSVESFALAFPSLQGLTSLDLQISSWDRLSNLAFNYLCGELRNLKLLELLTLIWKENGQEIKDTELKILGSSLKNLKFLSNVSVSFRQQIGPQQQEFILQGTKQFKLNVI